MAEEFNCSSTAILNHAKKIGYDVNSNKQFKLSEKDKEDIINNYNTKTSTELANTYNVSRGMITKIWYDNNLYGKEINNPKTVEKDITNQVFGYWKVLYKTNKRNSGGIIYWHCRCECGQERDVLGSSLRNGLSLSCGCKQISKGEEKIKEILMQANIPFVQQKTFDTCKFVDTNALAKFDFYVDNKYCIEFDGSQHFYYTGHDWNTEEKFIKTKEHDVFKNQWCKNNNIPLIRIPYTHLKEITLKDLILESSKFIQK